MRSPKMNWLAAAPALALGAMLLAGAAAPAGAATIYLDVPDAEVTPTGSVITARDRLSRAGSADQMLFVQPNPAGFPNRDIVGFANGFTGSSAYDFSLTHTAATGRYEFGLRNGTVGGNVSFRSGGANGSVTHVAPGLSYNMLHVFAVATTAGSSVNFTGLFFTPGIGLSTSGVLETSGSASAAGTTTYDQWLALPTGGNLASFDWTIGARVTLTAGGTNPSSGEGIKFEITGKAGTFSPPPPPQPIPVPEPATLALFGVGLAALATLRRRRRLRPDGGHPLSASLRR